MNCIDGVYGRIVELYFKLILVEQCMEVLVDTGGCRLWLNPIGLITLALHDLAWTANIDKFTRDFTPQTILFGP